jgi:hypothetical protein
MNEPRKKRSPLQREKDFLKGAIAHSPAQNPQGKLSELMGDQAEPVPTKRITADIDIALHRRLKQAALDMGVSQTEIIRKLLDRNLP